MKSRAWRNEGRIVRMGKGGLQNKLWGEMRGFMWEVIRKDAYPVHVLFRLTTDIGERFGTDRIRLSK